MKNLFKVFLDGILFMFSIGENPIEKYRKEKKSVSDMDNMTKDWCNVGNDIRNAYEKYTTCQ